MKKTLLVTIDFPPSTGGVATYWKQVALTFPDDKLVILTIPDRDASDQQIRSKVIRSSLFYKYLWPKWVKGILTIYRVYKREDCRQILVGQLLPVGSMVYLLHKLLKIPYVIQVYGMDLLKAKEHSRKYRLAQKILMSAEQIVVNTNAIGDIVKSYTDASLSSTVVYPIPASLPEANSTIVEQLKVQHNLTNKKVVLTVGRLVPRKGQDMTLGAMLHVWQSHPDTVYVIAGGGSDMDRLRKMAESHKSQVIFTGWIDDEERNAWLSLCDLFVMPARASEGDIEGFGIVYLEAGAFGKPVIGGKSGGVGEAILDGQTGILVNPLSMDEVAQAILKILANKGLAEKLGEQGKLRLERETWDREKDKFIQLLS